MKHASISLWFLAACYTSGPEECVGDTWGHYEWVVDGVSGASGCFPTLAWGTIHGTPGPGVPETSMLIGGPAGLAEARLMPIPFCQIAVEPINIPMRTGTAGSVDPSKDTNGRSAAFYVSAPTERAAGPDRCKLRNDGYAPPTGGAWTVLQGGTWGDIVDVEIRDVTFDPTDGHDLVITYGRWVVRLPESPAMYP